MNTPTHIQITVTKVIAAPGRGILAAGHIDGGLVHVGDLLQVHNHHIGPTARVGQITLGSKVVKEAHMGEEALLLLERIEETEIHVGDHLMPGEGRDLRLTDEEAWEKLPERIEPILHFRQFAGKIAVLAFLSIFWIVPVLPIFGMIRSTGTLENIDLGELGFFSFWYVLLGIATYIVARGFIKGLQGRSRFLQGQSQTMAKILRRKVVEHSDKYGTTYTFHLQLEFTPTLAAVSAGTMRLEASTNQKLYERLLENKSVNITYAVEDPHIFILEGE